MYLETDPVCCNMFIQSCRVLAAMMRCMRGFLWGSMTCLENWWNLLFFKCPGLCYDNQCCESDRSVLIGLLMQWYCHSPSDTVSRFDWYTLLDTGHWSPIRAAPVNNGKNTSDYHGFVSVNIRSADAEEFCMWKIFFLCFDLFQWIEKFKLFDVQLQLDLQLLKRFVHWK